MVIDRLYKYGHINKYSEYLFSTAKIWLSAPSELNDPFECRPWFTFEGTKEEVIELLGKDIQKQNPTMPKDIATAEAESIYLQGRHRDVKTWEAVQRDLIHSLGSNIGLYCLSRIPDSILMWSHYSSEHQGYCLEFDATDQMSVFGEALPVLYSDSYPLVDYFKTPKERQFDPIFLTKFTVGLTSKSGVS